MSRDYGVGTETTTVTSLERSHILLLTKVKKNANKKNRRKNAGFWFTY